MPYTDSGIGSRKRRVMKKISVNGMNIYTGSGGQFFLSAGEENFEDFNYGVINTNIRLNSNMYEAERKEYEVMPAADHIDYCNTEYTDKGFSARYKITDKDIYITENIKYTENAAVLEQFTTVYNDSGESVDISKLSSANVLGIGISGGKYFEKDRFAVHFCSNHWQGEGQWHTFSLFDLGIYPASRHVWERNCFRLSSAGSWSTVSYYPMLIIEDKEKNECWYFERAGAENWYIEISAAEGFGCKFLCVSLGGADEELGFRRTLNPKESYTTCTSFYGVVKGGFNEGVKELLKYKRMTDPTVSDIPPVCFNDFMNCNWANPDAEKLIPLIDKAAELGIETFVIDSGWSDLGEWVPNDKTFGSYGFEGIIKYIISKGMKPGVWFEFEAAGEDFVKKCTIKDYLLMRNGKTILPYKVNMRSAGVRAYLTERIDYLYNMGIRFIKNDHNSCETIGSNAFGECPAEGVRLNAEALYDFIEEIKAKYKDLVIEDCSAGGARADHGTLRHFHMLSTSDQEDYRLYPSIVTGSLAFCPPEKAGIWVYPYPYLYENFAAGRHVKDSVLSCKDGEETVFNMVTGMCGVIYMSGKINFADEFNTLLIKEGIEKYKKYRGEICRSEPEFFLPMKNMGDKSFNAYGMRMYDGKEMLLFVWNLTADKFSLDLSKYGYKDIEAFYPERLDGVKYNYAAGKLSLEFAKNYSARIFRLFNA